jgi:hypothetical protein
VGKPVSLKFTNFDSHLWNRHPACLKKNTVRIPVLKKNTVRIPILKNTGRIPVKKHRLKKHRQDACSTVAINHAKLI